MQDVHHIDNEPVYATRAVPHSSLTNRKHSISVINLSNTPRDATFHRPRRTVRSVSPSSSFRYILPFNSTRQREQTSLGNRQDVPITITKSPMYSEGYL